jgi:integrase/recombinase XerD
LIRCELNTSTLDITLSLSPDLLQAGVNCSVIALWLGHESIETTQVYLDANLA